MERPGPSPFRPGGNPFSRMPNGSNPEMIHPDVAHTFHIEGVGVSFVASGIVMCSKKGLFGDDRSLEKRLESAYSNYGMVHCQRKGHCMQTLGQKVCSGHG